MADPRQHFRWAAVIYEYAFTPVPTDQRKSTPSVLMVTLGYAMALSCFVIGTKVGYALPLGQAVAACVIGNLILILIGVSMGFMAADTGWSTTFLARQMFGRRAAALVSVLIALLSIYWVGMNGDSFAHMIVTVFPRWPVPVAVTAVILVALWGLTAAIGWRGLELTSWLLTPLALILALAGAALICTNDSLTQALRAFVPSGSMTMTAAVAAVTGNYIFGCIITPDLCRFAKSRRAVVCTVLPAHTLGFILPNLCGVLVAQAGNSGDFSAGIVKIGLAIPFLLCSVLGLWTTENYNLYGGSLAIQNLFLGTAVEGNLSHRLTAWLLAGLSAAFAATRALNYLIPVVTLISILVPPVAGAMFGQHFILRKLDARMDAAPRVRRWFPAWLMGSAAGAWALHRGFLIPPVIALLTSCAAYLLLSRPLRTRRRRRVADYPSNTTGF